MLGPRVEDGNLCDCLRLDGSAGCKGSRTSFFRRVEDGSIIKLPLPDHNRVRSRCFEAASDVRAKEDIPVGKYGYGDGLFDRLNLVPVRRYHEEARKC